MIRVCGYKSISFVKSLGSRCNISVSIIDHFFKMASIIKLLLGGCYW
ncbi:MAG: hypothetical protein ACJAXY_000073 [Nonlabens sp.]|jgi:hypothetical protein